MKFAFKIILALQCVSAIALAQGGSNMVTAKEVIKQLNLKPLNDEGGYFRQTFKSERSNVSPTVYGTNPDVARAFSTAIYFLVVPNSFSALHRIPSDEVFHFYGGDPVEMIQIDQNGNISHFILGGDIFNGQTPQIVVPRGVWQGSRLIKGGAWALMGTTVAPGFEFIDLEVADRETLLKEFPQHSNDIIRFSRGKNEKAH